MLNRGSEWHRWDPHIHTPGTVVNDQFDTADPWGTYLTTLESLTPVVEAIAVTDYYVTDRYEELLGHKKSGRLPRVQLVFPNIELRLDVAAKSGFVNMHMLVSPECHDHLVQVGRILKRLRFSAFGDSFDCTRDELIRLGRCASPAAVDERVLLEKGATQFKVNFDQLRTVLRESDWAQRNILVAVAGGTGDGTSGMAQAADATIRQEIEKFAHIIFSSTPAQREFWIGKRAMNHDEIRRRYGGCKPCLHGSDAHNQKSVGQASNNRFSWIKGAVEFDSLRQACIDPEWRAYIGETPPHTAMPSQVISEIRINGAEWVETPSIPLNPGLIAIVGARGSGKTALADMLAAGCDAISPLNGAADSGVSASFLVRARSLLDEASVTLSWGNGATVTHRLDGSDMNEHMSYPRARYLSQQFVEELCSAKGVSDGLVHEIERVVYESHTQEDRDWAADFAELRDQRVARFQQARKREAAAIEEISERIANELEKEGSVPMLAAQVAQKRQVIDGYIGDRSKLVVKGTEAQADRHTKVSAAVQKIKKNIQGLNAQRRVFVALQDEVKSMRATGAPELLRQTQARHTGSGLSRTQWEDFLLVYRGDVDASLAACIEWADDEIAKATGTPPGLDDSSATILQDETDLSKVPLATLTSEMARLEEVIGAHKIVREQYASLTGRIAAESSALQALEARLLDAQGAMARRRELQGERDEAYGRVFQAIIDEQSELKELYAPLMARLAAAAGTLGKLSFSVRRLADVDTWASTGEEELLDRRKAGPFHGRGALVRAATEALMARWESGTAAEVQAAMSEFVGKFSKDFLAHAPYPPGQQIEFRAWTRRFAHWLFGTEHISVRYEIAYEGVDIRKLSPGTRGVVLLLLYLALDDTDDRPLIIDQPEENLDPKSVFEELVGLFVSAKMKRQVVIVTHNANLVVNTDAEQVIVAEAGPRLASGLPSLRYVAGGLESSPIRKAVCEILEGGETAFRERARRLRVRLER